MCKERYCVVVKRVYKDEKNSPLKEPLFKYSTVSY